jgi:hypothetical protein
MFNMYVGLPHNFKGTHMSRFVEILNSHEREISVENFPAMLRDMVVKLEAETGHIEMNFPYFINKTAPVSGVQSLMDYDVTFIGDICWRRDRHLGQGRRPGHQPVPVLEEDLRARRAQPALARHRHRPHQRPRVDRGNRAAGREEASCELFGLLKRPDEKYVTERAYDNPKFVEDMVRDVAARLNAEEAHRRLRRRIGELRVDPQPFGLRTDRARQDARIEPPVAVDALKRGEMTTGRPAKKGAEAPFLCPSRKPLRQLISGDLADQLFLDTCRLAGTLAQVVQLGATDITTTLDFNGSDQRGIGLESTLDAFAGRNLANGESRSSGRGYAWR